MPWVEFEPTIPALEREKTIHALDPVATVIGCVIYATVKYIQFGSKYRSSKQLRNLTDKTLECDAV
jgi:hypothetical protein